MTLPATDKYKIEYAEVGNLRRHYSVVRSGLTTFSLTASLAAFASCLAQPTHPRFLAFVGVFMLIGAGLACFVFSYRTEKANLYLRELWQLFDGQRDEMFPQFGDFKPVRRAVINAMLTDEMNWALVIAAAVIGAFFCWG